MKAMILAAGFGTRLRPVTYTLPKPMVPVCNRPLLAWAIEPLLAAGIREIAINLHHLPEAIEEFVKAAYGSECDVEFSREEEILGTGGGVRRVRRFLETAGEFVLVNGDTIQRAPYEALRDTRREKGALAALSLRVPPPDDRFTPVYLDHGVITGFGQGTGEALMFSGTHVIGSEIFPLIPDKEFSGIVDEVYVPAMKGGTAIVAGVKESGAWFDVGNAKRLIQACHGILDLTLRGELPLARGSALHGDSIADDTARVSGDVAHSSIGARSVVAGSVRDSAVWDDCEIPAAARLERCIVAHGVSLPAGSYADVLITRDDPAIPAEFEAERRDGLVITAI